MKGTGHILGRLLALIFGCILVCTAGCGAKEIGPKHADHKEAHSPYYHPEIARNRSTPDTQPAGATTQPFAMTLPAHLPTGPVGNPVLFINNQPLTVQDILEPILPELSDEARTAVSEGDYYRTAFKIVSEEIRRQASAIAVYEQAKKKLPEKADEVLAKDADKTIQRIVDIHFGGAKARYEAHLKALDLTLKDVKEKIKRQLLVTHFLHERFEPLVADPLRRELLRYYQTHPDEFTTIPKAELFLIEIPIQYLLARPVAEATADQIAAARETARKQLQRAREELDSGVEFGAVARNYSRGTYRENGGAWGEVTPGSLTRQYAKAVEVLFSLDEGHISDIIETNESLFIVRCGKKTPAVRTSFEEAQSKIVDRLRDEQYGRLTADYIAGLMERAGLDQRQQQEFLLAVLAAVPRPPPRQSPRSASLNPGG